MNDHLPLDDEHWLEVRRHLEKNRFSLGVDAAAEYPTHLRFFETPLLTTRGWIPDRPIPLGDIELQLNSERVPVKTSREYGAVLPSSANEGSNYADVYQRLAAPRVFENRTTYRMHDAMISDHGASRLVFSLGRYFDSLNTGEAAGHAYAAQRLGRPAGTIRSMISDPCDPRQRPVNMAVSALTLRRKKSGSGFEFFLHWRDPQKVGHAGGLYQVVPSGVFQASGEQSWNQENDFSLVKFLARELAEELLGRNEVYENSSNGIDYESWDFYSRLQVALDSQQALAWCVGLGADPLTFATDLLVVLVFESDAFEKVFGRIVAENDEGRVLSAKSFDEQTVMQLVTRERMQAAGAALLAAAWHHRRELLT